MQARGRLIYKLADLIEQNAEELASMEALVRGSKPVWCLLLGLYDECDPLLAPGQVCTCGGKAGISRSRVAVRPTAWSQSTRGGAVDP